MKYIRNSKGISIVEVVASFVILAIILMSFMGILVQTKRTNASSETIQDATYVAQAEMEALYLVGVLFAIIVIMVMFIKVLIK